MRFSRPDIPSVALDERWGTLYAASCMTCMRTERSALLQVRVPSVALGEP